MAAGSTLTKTIQFEQILVLAWIPLLLGDDPRNHHLERPWRAVAGDGRDNGSHPARGPSAARVPGGSSWPEPPR
jgi:hypothetical protein